MTEILRLKSISRSFDGLKAIDSLDMNIEAGKISAIIGPNGAGKSTVLKVISGFLYPKKGDIIFKNKEITAMESYKRMALGIGYFLQGGEVFNDMSIYENLEMGGANLKKSVFKETVEETLNLFPLLKDKLNKRAGLLSGGEKQMLALGIVLMAKPRLLLLDEPSAGLAPGLVKVIMEKIVEINRSYGTAILLVEQKIGQALKVASRGYLLKNGEVALEGLPEDIRRAITKRAVHA